jgi:UDP-glucose 4-epimerase
MSQNQNIKTVVVTGASGYIGGSTCIALNRKGYKVIGVDRRPLPEHLESYVDKFENVCFTHPWSLEEVEKADAIIHCAGTSLVGPSVTNPHEYYENNVCRTEKLLNHIRLWNPNAKFIFSSSASVYGDPLGMILFEGAETKPIAPYGQSKLMTEMMLEWYAKAYKLKYVAFRYFNACGAVEDAIHGPAPDGTHIFAKVFEAAMTGQPFTLYGATYPTRDGTCIRDYVHVMDIVDAHILGIDKDIEGIYNIGTLKGSTNLEVFDAVETFLIDEEYLNDSMICNIDPPRPGDATAVIASPEKLQSATGWKAKRDLDTIIKDLFYWYASPTFNKLKQRSISDIHPAL